MWSRAGGGFGELGSEFGILGMGMEISLSVPDSNSSQLDGRKMTLSLDEALLLLLDVELELDTLDSLPLTLVAL